MKQMIEIEVPEGKIAVLEDNKIIFKDEGPHWKSLKSFEECFTYLLQQNLCRELINEFDKTEINFYSRIIVKYRIVVAALTNNEKRSLITGEKWYPAIDFCSPDCLENCYGEDVVGKIKSEGKEYLVVGGAANDCPLDGLGSFSDDIGVTCVCSDTNFISVSSKEIAKHISTYFGKLLFEVQYGGCNCDWEWVE